MTKAQMTMPINGQEVTLDFTEGQVNDLYRQIKRKKITYKDIKSVEDAFDFLGMNYQEWKEKYSDLEPHVIAYMELTYIVKALNGGEWMDYSDTDVYKYFPWFHASGSPSGFSSHGYVCGCGHSSVGSRLCVKSSEIATYAGKQFLNIYNQYIN